MFSHRIPSHRALACAVLLTTACSAAPEDTGVTPFGTPIVSNGGKFRVTLTPVAGEALLRGTNQLYFDVSDVATSSALDGLGIEVVPMMPAMAHGSATLPVVTGLSGGRYRLDEVELPMAGLWELRTTITGSESDKLAPRVQVP